MIRIALFALVWLACGSESGAQQWAQRLFAATSHDFGTVARGSKQEFAFELTNVYAEPVRIASVRSSCACAAVSVLQDRLEPSERGAVVVGYHTRSHAGKQSGTITVVFDRPHYAEVQLQITGYIRSDVALHPAAASFGSIAAGAGAETELEVASSGTTDWEIVEVRTANRHLEAQFQETLRRGGEVKYRLVVRLKSTAPIGYLRDQLALITNDSGAAPVSVPVEGHVQSPLTVSPASLLLGVLSPGETVQKTLVVRGNRPFRILDIRSDGGRFCFGDLPAESKPLHVIPVRFTASGDDLTITERIEIETDLGAGLSACCTATAILRR